jgi:hypothetical protein
MDVHAMVDFYTLDIYSTKYKNIFSVTAVWLHKNEWWLLCHESKISEKEK